MRAATLAALAVTGVVAMGVGGAAQMNSRMAEMKKWAVHDESRPLPPVVDPGPAGPPAPVPSDAIVLFDGNDLSAWETAKGAPAEWAVRDGYMEVVKGKGGIRTKQGFGDCQLHVEWAAPAPPVGQGQDRGNSGVFLMDIYEVQVLDTYQSRTYADGMAGAIYGQYPRSSTPPVSRESGRPTTSSFARPGSTTRAPSSRRRA